MKNILAVVSVLSALAMADANAHGCSGQGACTQDQYRTEMGQGQDQGQNQQSANHNNISTHNATNNHNRYWNVRPVHVDQPHIVVPSAQVNRSVAGQCGPRMQVVHRTIKGLNNRPLTVAEFDAGTEQYVIPAEGEPYRKIKVGPYLTQFIGHRINATTAVVTVSTGGGLGFGFNGNNGGGASVGATSGSGIQRLVTTINLEECVALEMDERPLMPRG